MKPKYTRLYATESWHDGHKLTLVGQWGDLAAYYRDDLGRDWAWQGRFVRQDFHHNGQQTVRSDEPLPMNPAAV